MILKPNNIKWLVVHCSDTENNAIFNTSDIHCMHLNFGWDGIGYHKVILRTGKIENGRPEYWIGAHVKGVNKESLGVCLMGRDKFTKRQFISLERLLIKWRKIYPNAKIVGHRDIGNTQKTCPNFDVIKWSLSKNI
jgi:N-acetylmuramoyl-L-alanine amidase